MAGTEPLCSTAGCSKEALSGYEHCSNHHKEQANYAYGLDAELQRKATLKYDPVREQKAAQWLESMSGISQGDASFQEWLKSGVVLCEAINRIQPGAVRKINKGKMPFVQRENITQYLDKCRELGMAEISLFVTQDLFEGDNLLSVVDNIFALSSLGMKLGHGGPHIGSKMSDKNVRQFSTEVMQQGKSMMSRITQGSYGYQPEREKKLDKIILLDSEASKSSSEPSRQNIGSHGIQPKTVTYDRLTRRETGTPTGSNSGPSSVSADIKASFCSECGTAATGGKFCGECGSKM